MTGAAIDQLNTYYGKVVWENSDSVEKMSDANWVTYYHRASTEDKPQHHLCPTGPGSWCDWQKCQATKEQYKFKSGFPPKISEAIKPAYEDLTKPEFLERCLGAYSQNANESFNRLVWKVAPKTKMGSTPIVEIAANVAACIFNRGTPHF